MIVRNSSERPSATSLPASPQDDSHARSTRYLIMMGVRIVCFILMVVITPYGWYTWVLGAAAIFLPYIAVVSANVSKDVGSATAENPERELPERPSPAAAPSSAPVIRVQETSAIEPEKPPREDGDG